MVVSDVESPRFATEGYIVPFKNEQILIVVVTSLIRSFVTHTRHRTTQFPIVV